MMPSSADPSVPETLDALRRQSPGAPFLALGQTVLWDEPVKAVWRRLLDQFDAGATLIAGVHDTDYFAKTSAHLDDDQKYVALPHDDGRTRDLWSAAGEMSALFGSESVPTRQMFLRRGVPFDWLAKGDPGGKDAFYADKTTAWGWRGIVSTQSHSVIAHDIPILEICDALLTQLEWGFAESLACLDSEEARQGGEAVAAKVRGWVSEFLADCQADCRLSDLYRWLLPRFYTLLLQSPPENFQTTASTELFQFNTHTHQRPRFRLLQAFLEPATRRAACAAYDHAVAGSGIYTLDGFGAGAVPFDVVIPGHGRGTLRLTPRGVTVETTPVATVLGNGPIQTLAELANLLEGAYGPDVVLVGKAVTLVDMIAAEYVIVFHETASGYTGLTRRFNEGLAAAGAPQTLHPIVRLTYPTWDALGAVSTVTPLRLPLHLARAFGRPTVSASEFASEWRGTIESQRAVLRDSQSLRRPRDLMSFLEGKDQTCWCDRRTDYEAAQGALKEIAAKSSTLADRIAEHRHELRLWRTERQGLEARMGADWRQSVEPIRGKIRDAERRGEDTQSLRRDLDRQLEVRRKAFEEPLEVCRERIRATQFLLSEFRRQRRLLERGPEARQARATAAAAVRDAQMARLDLVRDAFLTIEGLEHTHLRPTAWWLPLVSPDGAWLDAMVRGTQARLEPLA